MSSVRSASRASSQASLGAENNDGHLGIPTTTTTNTTTTASALLLLVLGLLTTTR